MTEFSFFRDFSFKLKVIKHDDARMDLNDLRGDCLSLGKSPMTLSTLIVADALLQNLQDPNKSKWVSDSLAGNGLGINYCMTKDNTLLRKLHYKKCVYNESAKSCTMMLLLKLDWWERQGKQIRQTTLSCCLRHSSNEFFIMLSMFEEKQPLQMTPNTALTAELEDEASRNWSRRRRRVVFRVEQVRVGHKLAGNYTQLDVLSGISIFHLFIWFIF